MGTEARIVISEDLVLDFAGLFSPIGEEKQAATSHVEPFLGTGEYKTITEPQKPAERLTDGLWDIMSLLSFVYDTARIQGIREERARRT